MVDKDSMVNIHLCVTEMHFHHGAVVSHLFKIPSQGSRKKDQLVCRSFVHFLYDGFS